MLTTVVLEAGSSVVRDTAGAGCTSKAHAAAGVSGLKIKICLPHLFFKKWLEKHLFIFLA